MKISKAVVFTLSLCLLLSSKDYAQQVVDVDTYTGSAITTIPLYTLRSGSLSYPIVLRNASNGIKPHNGTGLVGMGWNISTGGSISRVLRGLPDDYNYAGNGTTPAKQGWLYNNNSTTVGNFVPSADTILTVASDEQADYNFLNSLGGFTGGAMIDTEPDIFTVNTPDFSCSFVFDNSGKIAFLGKQDFKISYLLSPGGIPGFNLIDDKGNTYVFGDPLTGSIQSIFDPAKGAQTESNITHFKYQYYLYKAAVPFYSKWKLLYMQSPNGDRITFEYNSFPNMQGITQNGAVFPFKATNTEAVSVYLYDESKQSTVQKYQYSLKTNVTQAVQCTKVIGRAEQVQIKPKVIDVPSGNYWLAQTLVGAVEIYDVNTTLIRTFNLDYVAVPNNIFLKSLTEIGMQNVSRGPYLFEYNGVDLSAKTMLSVGSREDSFFEDEFGYQNAGACCDLPAAYKSYIYPSLYGNDRIRNQALPGYGGNQLETGNAANGVSLPRLLISTLSKITLPSGGVNRIFYEPNYYKDSINSNGYVSVVNVYGGGHRVNRLEFHDGVDFTKDIIKYYSYKQSNGKSSGVLLYRPLRTFNLNAYKNLQTNTVTYYHDLVNQYTFDQVWKRTLVTSDNPLNFDSDPGTFIGYKRVSVSQTGIGNTVYEYDIPGAFGKKFETDWAATRNRIARNSSISGATNIVAYDPGPIAGYYAYPFAPNPNYDFKRGLLRHISVYSNANFLVSRTDYDYTYLSTPSKVYGIRLDQYDAPFTYTASGSTVTNAFPMFIYCRYEINTNIHPLLQKTTTKIYDQNATQGYQTSSFQNNIETLEYTSANHDRVTRRVQTGSDGVELATNYKYSFDYTAMAAWAQQDSSSQAITKLKEQNIYVPIEIWTTKKEITDSSPLVTSANLSLFWYDPTKNTVSLRKTLSTAAGKPFASFTPSSITNGANSTFTFENFKYNRFTKYLNLDTYGNPRTTVAYNKSKASIHNSLNGTAIRAAFVNAAADEVTFSDFESADNDFAFTSSTSGTVTGRLNGSAMWMKAYMDQITKTLKKGQGEEYIFSCWIQSTSAGTITVNVRDNANVQVSKSIPYPVCSAWTYLSVRIPTTTLGSTLTITAQSDASISVDDALFYPATAIPTTYLYGPGAVKIAETDSRGVTTSYEYDGFNQIRYVRDQDKNIVKSTTYQIGGSKPNAGHVDFNDPSIVYFNQQVTFVATDNGAMANTTYKWKVVPTDQATKAAMKDFSNSNYVFTITGSNIFQYTFPYTYPYDKNSTSQKFAWSVRLLSTYNGVSDTTYTHTVYPTFPPINVTICADRPTRIDLCSTAPLLTDCNPSASAANGLTLIATVTGGSGDYEYDWERSDFFNANVPASTTSVYNEPDYMSPRTYSVTVKDRKTEGPHGFIINGGTTFTIETYKSDPNCTVTNQN